MFKQVLFNDFDSMLLSSLIYFNVKKLQLKNNNLLSHWTKLIEFELF